MIINNGINIPVDGGAIREDKSDKMRYDLIPIPMIKRVAKRYTEGAKVYGDRNWEVGGKVFMEISKQSAFRHFIQYMEGDEEEDHMSAVVFNLFAIETIKNNLSIINQKNETI